MWYAVRTKSREEDKLLKLIDAIEPNQDIFSDAFIIYYEKFMKRKGRMEKKKFPLFPGYLFFSTKEPIRLQVLLMKIPEYARILGYDEGPVPITQEEQDFLQTLINKDKTIETSEGYIVGDELIILEGPLVGKQGLIKKIDRHKRLATLEVEFLGQIVETQVGLEVVSKIKDINN